MKTWQITALVTAVILTSLVFLPENSSKENDYETWKKDYGMKFTKEEEEFRKIIFHDNLRDIMRHNAKSDKSYEMGVNQFTHLSPT